MTRVDFYILSDGSGDGLHRFACRLVEKAWKRGMQCHINAASPEQADRLDDLLWTFRDVSFIPHGRTGGDSAGSERLAAVIGSGEDPQGKPDVLINLSAEVPSFFSRFERVAELVDNDSERRTAGRQRFRYYRDRGYPLESHNIG